MTGKKVIALFDVDGTLTAPRKVATKEMLDFMQELRKTVKVGIVGGSDLHKIAEQLGDGLLTQYDYVFAENGLVAHKEGKELAVQSLKTFLGEDKLKSERDEFEKYDEKAGVRKAFVEVLRTKFAHLGLTYSIGGQISFDVFPQGWDKTYCLQFLTEFDEIHFFGDKTYKGGNDHEIFESERTLGHTVTSPDDTRKQCTEIFLA
eukprot:XP_001692807.1 phosphomannomutase [Chlamydomonas reinhardtii]